MIRYSVTHTTRYQYGHPVTLTQNQAHLLPRDTSTQSCEATSLQIQPRPQASAEWCDFFGNRVHYFSLHEPHHELTVTASSTIAVQSSNEPPASKLSWNETVAHLANGNDDETMAALAFTFDSQHARRSVEAKQYAALSLRAGRPLIEAVMDLTNRIFREFQYDPSSTNIYTPTHEVFRRRRGVCQDFAHLQIACLRSWGLAARYVSGYLQTDPPPGQPKLIGADASHAWLSVFVPKLGWVDFDPTNNQIPTHRHITVAWGRDYADVCPIKGVYLGGSLNAMQVSVDVTPIEELSK